MKNKSASCIFLLFCILTPTAHAQEAAREFDFASSWNWETLRQAAPGEETLTRIEQLEAWLSLADARFLFRQLSQLSPPEDIRKLKQIEQRQSEWGGGFYGIIPSYFDRSDTLITPHNLTAMIELAAELAAIRTEIREKISKPGMQYPVRFSGKPVRIPEPHNAPADWQLLFELNFVEDVLLLYEQDAVSETRVASLAQERAIREMLEHRKSLGYIPEPLPNSEDMTRFILHSASRRPLDMIWKWLNPWNYFCFSDLFMLRAAYGSLLDSLRQHQDDIEDYVMGRLYHFAPVELAFEERLSFGVNWGIRSWATPYSLGTNIVQFKDDFSTMLRTTTHETFHRLQLKICPVATSRKTKSPRKFEDLVFYDFPDTSDQKFYEALSYIMLEGTATLVGGVDSSWQALKNAQAGRTLLLQFYHALYEKRNYDEAERLLNQGLQSNGPFYGLGYYMGQEIIEESQPERVLILLQSGSPAFFTFYSNIAQNTGLPDSITFPSEIVKAIRRLADSM